MERVDKRNLSVKYKKKLLLDKALEDKEEKYLSKNLKNISLNFFSEQNCTQNVSALVHRAD